MRALSEILFNPTELEILRGKRITIAHNLIRKKRHLIINSFGQIACERKINTNETPVIGIASTQTQWYAFITLESSCAKCKRWAKRGAA